MKIACIGDSLTYGYGLFHREKYNYPAQLNTMLHSNYEIKNFGINGACATPGKNDSYLNNGVKNIREWKPDILLIMLGSNDSKEINWISGEEYQTGMESIIEAISENGTKIVLVTPPPCRLNPYGIRDSVINNEIIPALESLSRRKGYPLIDLYRSLDRDESIYIDNIHLNKKGYSLLSSQIAGYLMN